MRHRLLAVTLASALAVPVVLLLPVTTAPAATPHPVKPKLQQFRISGIDAGVARSLGRSLASSVATSRGGGRLAVLTSQRSTRPFRLAGVTWTGPAPVSVQLRVRTAGAWSAWEATPVQDDRPDPNTDEGRRVRGMTQPLLAPGSDGVQVRVDTVDGTAPAGLEVSLVDPGTSAADGVVQPTPPSSAAAAAGMPPIVTRAEWGADESLRDPDLKYTTTVRMAFVHHTASANNYWQRSGWTEADAARDIRAIYAYSVLSGGYADIPYNFLVDYGGRVYEGRAGGVDKAVRSAATGGFNTDTMAVSALGNFATARPSPQLVAGIERIVAWKLGLFHRDPTGTTVLTSAGGGTDKWPVGAQVRFNTISGHRDAGATACPGGYLYPWLPTIRSVAKQLQQAAFYDPAVSSTIVPSGTSVTLSTRTSSDMGYQLQVLDSGGHAVKTLKGFATSATSLALTWNLRNDAGKAVPEGSYTLALVGSSSAGSAVPFSVTILVGKLNIPVHIPMSPVYWLPGIRESAGHLWRTTCTYPNLDLLQCRVEIRATWWQASGSTYVAVTGWRPNDITYVAYDSPGWSTGTIAVPGSYTVGGRQWRTTCSPSASSGPRTCQSSILASVVVATRTSTGYRFAVVQRWRLNSIAYLPAPPGP
jgi:hypothetical protein